MVHALAFSPSNLPPSEEARQTRRLMLPDRRRGAGAVRARLRSKGTFALERKPEWWANRLWSTPASGSSTRDVGAGRSEGYLYYEVDTVNGPFKLELTLTEFVAATPEAHRDSSAPRVARGSGGRDSVRGPADAAWPQLLRPQNLHPGPEIGLMGDTGNLGTGLMLRVLDVKPALELFPVAASARGEVVIEVEDDVVPHNARSYRVLAREGRMKVRPETARASGMARLPRLTVAADLYGTPARRYDLAGAGCGHRTDRLGRRRRRDRRGVVPALARRSSTTSTHSRMPARPRTRIAAAA